MTVNIRIALTNLGKYNEGELVYTWLDLPASEGEIEDAMKRIEIGSERWDGGVYEEWFISDYEAPFHIEEYTNLTDLNETAELLTGLGENEMNAVVAIRENDSSLTFEEAAEMVKNGDAILHYDCRDMADVARYYVEESGVYDTNNLGTLANYIDYEALGRDMEIEGTFLFIDNGVVVEVIY